MKDIKKALSEYTVPVDGAEWQQIAADPRLVRFNRGRRIRRIAAYSGAGLAAAALIVVGLLLSRPKETPADPAPAAVVTDPIAQPETPATVQENAIPMPAAPVATDIHPAEPELIIQASEGEVATITPTTPSATPLAGPKTAPAATMPPAIVTPTVTTTTPSATPPAIPTTANTASAITPTPEPKNDPTQSEEPVTVEYQLFVPNSFTPDGNGNNDIFMPKANFTVQDYEINIFARNGSRVFTSHELEQGWDGYNHGTLLPAGAYMYVIRYTDPDGNAKTLKGQVVLLK
ncbi:MAG: gliding motility-associated C-terminal domain-containing protein [Bacteroidales bacterium]|nr:gliding motility-associated C-terminal domain-containing protein [Bacteroidales bacterium]